MRQGGGLTVDHCFALLPSSLGSGDCFWALQCVVSSSHESSLEVRLASEQRQLYSETKEPFPPLSWFSHSNENSRHRLDT